MTRFVRACSWRALPVLFLMLLASALRAEPREYVISLSPAAFDVDSTVAALAKDYDAEVLQVWKHALRGFHARMSADAAQRMASDGRVRVVEPNGLVMVSGDVCNGTACAQRGPVFATKNPTPSCELVPLPEGTYEEPAKPPVFGEHKLWHLNRITHRVHQDSLGTLGDYTYPLFGPAGAGVKIYVIDHGVVRHHQEFWSDTFVNSRTCGTYPPPDVPTPRVLPGTNTVPVEAVPSPAHENCRRLNQSNIWFFGTSGPSHGTMVASLAAGRTVGVARNATIVPVKVNGCDNEISYDALLAGFNYVRQTATPPAVVNMSGYRFVAPCPSYAERPTEQCLTTTQTSTLEEAINSVVNAGIPVVASANNFGREACDTVPPSLSRRRAINTAQPGVPLKGRVISVGALHKDQLNGLWDQRTPTSNRGDCVDIWAPGDRIVSASTQSLDGYNWGTLTGTSYAAPIVSGIIARLMSEDPSLYAPPLYTIADRVWERLENTATRLGQNADMQQGPAYLAYIGNVTITDPPRDVSTTQGTAPVLNVETLPAGPGCLHYQWYQGASGDTSLPMTPTTKTLTLSSAVQGPDKYWVRVTNSCLDSGLRAYGDSIDATVRVWPCGAPTGVRISSNATSSTTSGSWVRFTATADGAQDVTYEWRRGTPGDMKPVLATGNPVEIQVGGAGQNIYWARAIRNCGGAVHATNSSGLTITLASGGRRRSARVLSGGSYLSTTIYAIARGGSVTIAPPEEHAAFSYQWYRDGALISSAGSISEWPTGTTTYWVRTVDHRTSPAIASDSSVLTVIVNDPHAPVGVSVSPGTVVQTGTLVELTASLADGEYEWREGPDYNTSRPVIGTLRTLYANVSGDSSFWVRVKSGGSYLYSEIVAITTICSQPWVTIGHQPNTTLLGRGDSVLLTAFSSPHTVYLWYQGQPGAADSLQIGSNQAQPAGPPTTTTYWVLAIDGCGNTAMAATTIRVCQPKISAQPAASYVVASGSTVNVTVSATAAQVGGTLTYVWVRVNADGSTTEVLRQTTTAATSTLPVHSSQIGTYAAFIYGTCEDGSTPSVRSTNTVVTLCDPAKVIGQPTSYSTYRGYSAGTSVTATGTGLSYQWYAGEKGNTTNPVGTNNRSLVITSVQFTEKYWVRVSGTCGTEDSNTAWISMYPQIYTHPQSQEVPYGGSAQLSVYATGGYLRFQWYQGESGDRSRPVGTNSPTLQIPAVWEPLPYWVLVTSGIAETQSYGAMVTPY
ncbi:MAG TPA: S8 family serine peptidase [Thermoanaerobaculia bacterium]|jgi:hypothetical protein